MDIFSLRMKCLLVTALFIGSTLGTGISYSQELSGGGTYGLGITDDASLAFAWKANSEPDLAGYKLHIGTVPGFYSASIDVGPVTGFRLRDLIRGMTYYFALTAYNTSGVESDFTPELSATIPYLIGGEISGLNSPNQAVVQGDATTNVTAAANQPPYFEPLEDVILSEGTTNYMMLLLGLQPGAEGETDAVTISAISSAPEIIPHPEVSYSVTDSTAILTLSTAVGAVGTATISVTANDGQQENSTFSRTFNVTVERLNSPPVISGILDMLIAKNRATAPIPFIVADAETPSADLTVTVTSSNPEVVPLSGLIVLRSALSSSLVIDPSNGREGVTMVTLTVADGTASASLSFQVTIF